MEETGLKFPLLWHGRLITYASAGDITSEVRQIFSGLGLVNATVSAANSSSSGTYRTWQLSATIQDLQTLRMVFTALEQIPGVKMLI